MPACLKLRPIPTYLSRHLSLLIKGVSGQDRREKQRLLRRLSTLRAEFNQLSQQLETIHHQWHLESQGLQSLYEAMKAERDDLQIEIWELEDLVEELFRLLTAAAPELPTVESGLSSNILVDAQAQSVSVAPSDCPTVESPPEGQHTMATGDLSNLKLALVGGHETTRRGVLRALTRHHGLTQWVELPPFSKHSLGRSNIKAKIHDCDLVVLITGYMKHKQTDSIMQLKRLKGLSGDILLLNCRGTSGVVREILTFIRQKNCEA